MTPCSWPVSYADCSGECSVYEQWPETPPEGGGLDRAQARALFEAQAVEYLWNWTGGVFGVCDVALRPCREGCAGNAQWATTFWGRGPGLDPGFPRLGSHAGGGSFYPVLVSGQWFNITCGCLGKCTCQPSGPSTLSLPGPVGEVTEVTIDGIAVPPDSYRVDRSRWLIRTDGQTWPGCQDMNVADDAAGSFVVRYTRGVPAPTGGQIAAGRLACELAKDACGDEDCALPDNWQTLTRQGITINADQNPESTTLTGIWSIDEWVKSVNRPRPIATVRSVDLPNLR